MHTNTDVNANIRGPPARSRVMCPLRPAAMQAGRLHPRTGLGRPLP